MFGVHIVPTLNCRLSRPTEPDGKIEQSIALYRVSIEYLSDARVWREQLEISGVDY